MQSAPGQPSRENQTGSLPQTQSDSLGVWPFPEIDVKRGSHYCFDEVWR